MANLTKIADLIKHCESDQKHEKPAKIYLANIQIGWLNFQDKISRFHDNKESAKKGQSGENGKLTKMCQGFGEYSNEMAKGDP